MIIYGIGTACKKRGVPAVAIVGGMGAGSEKLLDLGITSIIPTVDDVRRRLLTVREPSLLPFAGYLRRGLKEYRPDPKYLVFTDDRAPIEGYIQTAVGALIRSKAGGGS